MAEKITREEYERRTRERCVQNGTTYEEMIAPPFRLVIKPCDGSCGYEDCEGWLFTRDFTHDIFKLAAEFQELLGVKKNNI
jgi:predicted ATP-grasp superfamily ATP-dependent carboligase